MRFILSVLALSMFLGSCGRPNAENSNPKINIIVPPHQINSGAVSSLIEILSQIQATGHGVISLTQLVAVIPFTDAEMAEIYQSRDANAVVKCANSICVGTNSGRSQELEVSRLNLPSLGTPYIAIADDIRIKFRVGNDHVLDMCDIQGFSAKKFFVWSEIQAAKVTLGASGQAIDAMMIATPSNYVRCN